MTNLNKKHKSRSSVSHRAKLGKSDRYPSDYGIRDKEDASWQRGDKGQGREGLSKGYGGSGGKGTSASVPEHKGSRKSAGKE